MADQYRNIELQRMFEDLGKALEANQAKREAGRPVAVTERTVTASPGVPTARFPDVTTPPTARFPDANPPGVQQVPPMTVAGSPPPRAPMTPEQQAQAAELDAMGNQVVAGLRGQGPAVAPMGGAGVTPGQLDALQAQATAGMGTPAMLPQIRPVDTAGLDAYARMMRGGLQ